MREENPSKVGNALDSQKIWRLTNITFLKKTQSPGCIKCNPQRRLSKWGYPTLTKIYSPELLLSILTLKSGVNYTASQI